MTLQRFVSLLLCCAVSACGDTPPSGPGTEDPCLAEPHCDDGNFCTDDRCEPGVGCRSFPNAFPCDDGDACTLEDSCSNGACSGAPRDCSDENPCTDDSCDSLAGCVQTPNSAPCDDGNACTVGDVCVSGVCRAGEDTCIDRCAGVTCTTDSPCLVGRCDPATGGCLYDVRVGECDDGNPCTVGDHCEGTSCVASPRDCDDGNECTDDRCGTGGCVNTPVSRTCDDGDPCTLEDRCVQGECQSGLPKACDDANPCTTDTCDHQSGNCLQLANAWRCDDGDALTVGDRCQDKACVGGPPPVGTPAWIETIGVRGESQAHAVALDATTRDRFVCGAFSGTVVFGADTNAVRLSAEGYDDGFVARLAPDGSARWARRFGGPRVDVCRSLALDPAGLAVYVAGDVGRTPSQTTSAMVRFGPGEPGERSLTVDRDGDAFVARLDPESGELGWVQQVVGERWDYGHAVAASSTRVFLTGSFSQKATFGSGATAKQLEAPLVSSQRHTSVFVASYASDGTIIDAWNTGASDRVTLNVTGLGGIAWDPNDDAIVVAGAFRKAAVFGLGQPNETTLTATENPANTLELFFARYLADGTLVWAKSAGGLYGEWASAVAINPHDGGIALCGYFENNPTFGAGSPNAVTLTPVRNDDAFVAHYEADGTFVWAKGVGALGADRCRGVTFDTAGTADAADDAIVSVGTVQEKVELPGVTYTADSYGDLFVARHAASDGTLSWFWGAGAAGRDSAGGVAVANELVVAGTIFSTTQFAPGVELGAHGAPRTAVVSLTGTAAPSVVSAVASSEGGGEDSALTLALDPVSEDLLVGGVFATTAELGGPSGTVFSERGGGDAFLARYSPTGTLRWARTAGGSRRDTVNALAVVSDGSLYAAGVFGTTLTLNLGEPDAFELTAGGGSTANGWLARYSPEGGLQWARAVRASDLVVLYGVAVDPSNDDVLVAGSFRGELHIGQPDVVRTSAGETDGFVARLSPTGEQVVWLRTFGGLQPDHVAAMALDPRDSAVVLAGHVEGSTTFSPGEADERTVELRSTCAPYCHEDLVLARYAADGSLSWVRRLGAAGEQRGTSVAIAPEDGLIALGGTFGGADLVLGEGEASETTLQPFQYLDLLVAAYEPDGSLRWATRAYGEGYEETLDVAFSPRTGTVLSTGYFGYDLRLGRREVNEQQFSVLSGYGSSGAFLAEFAREDGQFLSAGVARSHMTYGATGYSLAVSPSTGSAFVGGDGTALVAFGYEAPTDYLVCAGRDAFVAEMSLRGQLRAGASCSPLDRDFVCGTGLSCDPQALECRPGPCIDGEDNDGAGRVAAAGPGCESSSDADETDACSATPALCGVCSDLTDADADGFAAFPEDPGCLRASGLSEQDCPDADGVVELVERRTAASTAGARDDATFSCSEVASPERVYALDVPGVLDQLTIRVPSEQDMLLKITRDACDTAELRCVTRSLFMYDVAPGRLYVAVEADDLLVGIGFWLEVSGKLRYGEPCSPEKERTELLVCASGACRDLADGRGPRCQ